MAGSIISEKLYQRVGRFPGVFFHQPMSRVLQNDHGDIGATSFICSPSTVPKDFSPPIDSTGMVNLV